MSGHAYQVQPTAAGRVPQNTNEWSTGLCAIFDDMEICLCVWLLGGCYLCYMASKLQENICTPVFVGVTPLRLKIRMLRGIEGSICDDHCKLMWCAPCAVCQMAREMKAAGYFEKIERQ